MATNGLSKSEAVLLKRRLAEVEALGTRPGCFGARELIAFDDLAKKLRTRIDPPTPSSLDAEAERIVEMYRGMAYWLAEAVAEVVA